MKKRKLNKDKAKILAILGTILFLIVGTGLFLLGCFISKWDVLSWFITPQALMIYALLSIGALIIFGIYVRYKLYGEE